MDEPSKLYAKLKTQKTILYDFFYMRCPEYTNLEQNVKSWWTRAGMEGIGEPVGWNEEGGGY